MELEKEITDGEFGFAWGEHDQFTFIRHPDGSIQKTNDELITLLETLASGDAKLANLDRDTREAVEGLAADGYLFDGPVVKITRDDEFNSAIRFALSALVGIFGLVGGALAGIEFYRIALNATETPLWAVGVWLVLAIPVLTAHELGHYLPSRRHVPVSIGLGAVNGVIPAVITDTTETWMLPRRHRVWINIAGPVAQIIAVAPLTIYFLSEPTGYLVALLTYAFNLSAVLALNPLIHGDGYLALTDLLAVENVKQQGVRDVAAGRITLRAAYAAGSYAFGGLAIGLSLVTAVLVLGSLPRTLLVLGILGLFSYADYGSEGGTKVLVSDSPEWTTNLREWRSGDVSLDGEGHEVLDEISSDEFVFDDEGTHGHVNRGMRLFDDLSDSVDEVDDYSEIEAEMESMGFAEDYDVMDEEGEIGIDELVEVDAEADEFVFE